MLSGWWRTQSGEVEQLCQAAESVGALKLTVQHNWRACWLPVLTQKYLLPFRNWPLPPTTFAYEPNSRPVAQRWQGEKCIESNNAGACCGARSTMNTSAMCRGWASLTAESVSLVPGTQLVQLKQAQLSWGLRGAARWQAGWVLNTQSSDNNQLLCDTSPSMPHGLVWAQLPAALCLWTCLSLRPRDGQL